MWFGKLPVEQCAGCVLAHSIKVAEKRIPKGTLLDDGLILRLTENGVSHLVVARTDENDISENEAASQIAAAAIEDSDGVRTDKAHTGRMNIYAACDGLLSFRTEAVVAANSVCEDITLSVVSPNQWVLTGRMIASAKIIPYAVDADDLNNAVKLLGDAALRVIKARPGEAVLIQTMLPSLKATALDKTKMVTEQRLQSRSMNLSQEFRCEHTPEALVKCLKQSVAIEPDLILIVGASAISDRKDVLPAAVELCGGSVQRVGIPVDPGNLLMLAQHGDTQILGLPGCARSPKHNGFDLLLDRMVCDLPITDQWLNSLCIGGLLDEVHSRPQPRVAAGGEQRIAALILAAGSSQRAGNVNKLLHEIDGKAMLCTVIESVQASAVTTSLLVTGHQASEVEKSIQKYAIETRYCANYASGMAHSIATGISALQSHDAVLVCLGDMPHINSEVIDQIISAGKDGIIDKIFIPVCDGQRGNPVMIGRSFFDALLQNEGDVGARYLIQQYPEKITEVEIVSDSVLRDYDTPEALQQLHK